VIVFLSLYVTRCSEIDILLDQSYPNKVTLTNSISTSQTFRVTGSKYYEASLNVIHNFIARFLETFMQKLECVNVGNASCHSLTGSLNITYHVSYLKS